MSTRSTRPRPRSEPLRHRDRVAFLAKAQTGNVTVYSESEGARVFVGSGLLVERWSFAMPLVALAEEHAEKAPPAPLASELYDAIRAALASLNRSEQARHQRMLGLRVADRLYVSGIMKPTDAFLEERTRRPRYAGPSR